MTNDELIDKITEITRLISVSRKQGENIAYLSGKVTGLSEAVVTEKFKRDANRLRASNWFVFNPAEWISNDCDWKMAMRLCLAVLPMCEMVFKQPDWKYSNGARLEVETAKRLGINTHDL